jgi:hypothetical protein
MSIYRGGFGLALLTLPGISQGQGVSAEIVTVLKSASDSSIEWAGKILAPPPQRPNRGANAEWCDPVRNHMIRFLKPKYAPSAGQPIVGYELPDLDVLTWTWNQKRERLWYYDLEGSSGVLYKDGTVTSILTDEDVKELVIERIRRILKLPNSNSNRQEWFIHRITLPSGKHLAYGRLNHNITLLANGKPTTPFDWDSNFAWWTDGNFVYFDWIQIDLNAPITGGNKVQQTSKTVRLKFG